MIESDLTKTCIPKQSPVLTLRERDITKSLPAVPDPYQMLAPRFTRKLANYSSLKVGKPDSNQTIW